MKIPFFWLHDPDEPVQRREWTFSLWLPGWLASLLKGKRVVVNISAEPKE